jgi:hypothetical protein
MWSRKGADELPVLSEPWGFGFNDTKVPASAGLFASNYNRIPANAVPVYHGPRGFCRSQPQGFRLC